MLSAVAKPSGSTHRLRKPRHEEMIIGDESRPMNYELTIIITIWWFPEIGVPPVIIHFNGMFPHKPTVLGCPHDYGNVHLTGGIIQHHQVLRVLTHQMFIDVHVI